jgi:hypothetical protein
MKSGIDFQKTCLIIISLVVVGAGCNERSSIHENSSRIYSAERMFFQFLSQQTAIQQIPLLRIRGFSGIQFEGERVVSIQVSSQRSANAAPVEFGFRQNSKVIFVFGRNIGLMRVPKTIIVAICNVNGNVENVLGFKTDCLVDDIELLPEKIDIERIELRLRLFNETGCHFVTCVVDKTVPTTSNSDLLQVASDCWFE